MTDPIHLAKLVQRGSDTAKNGFRNESDVVDKLNNWLSDADAQAWLKLMKYELSHIKKVEANLVKGHHKADVQIKITLLSGEESREFVSVKLVSSYKSGSNQIDKRWIDKYSDMWDMPTDIAELLKYFTGEYKPFRELTRNKNRMYINEFPIEQQKRIIDFFKLHKSKVISDILKGNDEFAVSWMLIYQKKENIWSYLPMTDVLDFYGQGDVMLNRVGGLKIGKVTFQRKGGDGGRPTANMLQFKFNPCNVVKKTTTL